MSHKAYALGALLIAAGLFAPPALASGTASSSAPSEAAVPALSIDVFDGVWEWIWFGSGKEAFDIETPEKYTLQFLPDGSAAIQADCNRGVGQYSFKPDQQVEIVPTAITMMLCEDPSLGDRFVQALGQVRLYFEQEGDFFLEAPMDSGTLRFRRQTTE